MLKFDRLLINPTPAEVAAALGEACREANKRCRTRLLKDDPAAWRKAARRAAAEPEGWELFRGGRGGQPATRVTAAWWTDTAGRKHVRVSGRRVERYDHYLLDRVTAGKHRPPLWHVHPDRYYQRLVGGQGDWLAVCGCGAMGDPASLGWMGDCCGPCHDYREEHGRLPYPSPALLTGHKETVRAVCVSATGRFVAGCEWTGRLLVWDREAGPEPVRVVTGFEVSPYLLIPQLALTADGNRLLVGGNGAMALRVYDLTDPGSEPANALMAGPFALDAVGDTVFYSAPTAIQQSPVADLSRARLVSGQPSGWAMALSPDGRTIAAVHQEVSLIDRETGAVHARRPLPEPPHRDSLSAADLLPPQPVVAFSEDGTRLAVALWVDVEVLEVPTARRVAATRWPSVVSGVGFAAGRLLIADNVGGLFAADPADPRRGVEFRWHQGPVRALATSPDGKTVATCGGEGVKLWPIERLLAGVTSP